MKTVNLSIKNVPEHVVEGLRSRANRHHRSLQGELMAIIEASVIEGGSITPRLALDELRALGLRTAGESVEMIRSDRDR